MICLKALYFFQRHHDGQKDVEGRTKDCFASHDVVGNSERLSVNCSVAAAINLVAVLVVITSDRIKLLPPHLSRIFFAEGKMKKVGDRHRLILTDALLSTIYLIFD